METQCKRCGAVCKRCKARDEQRAATMRCMCRSHSLAMLQTAARVDDPAFWGEIVRVARLETGIDLTVENWRDHTLDQQEQFGRACYDAQQDISRRPRRSRKSPKVT